MNRPYDTIDAIRYREQILQLHFINSFRDDELTLWHFQQDGAPVHTAQESINYCNPPDLTLFLCV